MVHLPQGGLPADCNDTAAEIHPWQPDYCDDLGDTDCDGDQDEDCWGNDFLQQCDSPDGAFEAMAAGGDHSCANEGVVTCWGSDAEGQSTPPAGALFRDVTAGDRFSCGVTTDRELLCWGADLGVGATSPPAPGDTWYTQVHASAQHACALDVEGFVHCWGDDSFGQSSGYPWM